MRALAQAPAEVSGGLDDRAARQRAADRGLGVAVEISTGDERSKSSFAAAVVSVRMVATDLMVFAGIDPADAVAAVREGLRSDVRSAPRGDPPELAPLAAAAVHRAP